MRHLGRDPSRVPDLVGGFDDDARAPYLLGGLGVQAACLRLGSRARLDRSAVLIPVVKSLAFDLRCDELMMTLRPIPKLSRRWPGRGR
jgi:hypothetical protein